MFDDFEFEQVRQPTPALAIGRVDKVVADGAVTFTVTVVNAGDAPSKPARLVVRPVNGPGWDAQRTDLGAVPPQGQQTVSVVVPIPAGVEGVSQRFDVVADPGGIAGDPDTDNNSLRVRVDLPGAVVSAEPPTSEAVTQAPSPSQAPETVSSSDGEPGVPFLGGLLVGALGAGGAAVFRYTRKIGQLNIQLKGTLEQLRRLELELRASDADPPDTCDRAGSFYCKREVTFVPRQRTIAAMSVDGKRGDQRISLVWPEESRDRLLEVARHAEGSRERSDELDAFAVDLAGSIAAGVDGPVNDLKVTVHVTGSSANGSFTPFVCTVQGGKGTYERIREWTKTVADEFDRTIASLARYDGSSAATERLAASLQVGIRALAQESERRPIVTMELSACGIRRPGGVAGAGPVRSAPRR